MTATHRRHDISDRVWELLEPHLPGGPGRKGRPARDNRLFLNALFWNLRTGAPPYLVRGRLWRDLPPDLGDWKNTQRSFNAASVAGGTGEYGKTCWIPSLTNRTSSG